MSKSAREALTKARRVVIKLGSAVVTRSGFKIDIKLFDELAEDVAWLIDKGVEVVIVTSGAVASGMGQLGLKERPQTIPEKQAIASVGQMKVVNAYKERFRKRNLTVGQILLTRDDFESRRRYLNAKETMLAQFSLGIVPVINENDTVVVDEIKLGDNDNLSSLVANLIEADCLVILSDVGGLYDGDPKANPDAKLIPRVDSVDDAVKAFVGKTKSSVGTGGMATKLTAASRAVKSGAHAVIASGKVSHVVKSIFSGEEVGTWFPATEDRLNRRKHWIAYTVKHSGSIVVDDGAARAIRQHGKSLLPKGIVRAEGKFDRGDAVQVVTRDGKVLAKGLTTYDADEVRAIVGLASWEIVDRLGYKYGDEVIHRDDLVVLA